MDEHEAAIYEPPKNGLPFLVVTFGKDGMSTQKAATRSEARVLLTRHQVKHSRAAARLRELTEPKRP
ncbi:hypothetical protein BH10PSE9_BH10PSE9_07410 [soil metagenome]